jgi:hypothetical protein
MIKNEYVVTLNQPKLNYTKEGDAHVHEALNIVLYAPHVRSLKAVMPLKQDFTRAIMSTTTNVDKEKMAELMDQVREERASKGESSKGVELDAQSIIAMLAGSLTLDMTEFYERFQKALKDPEIAKIDGEVTINDSFLHKLRLDTLEKLAGEYLANFIAPSVI